MPEGAEKLEPIFADGAFSARVGDEHRLASPVVQHRGTKKAMLNVTSKAALRSSAVAFGSRSTAIESDWHSSKLQTPLAIYYYVNATLTRSGCAGWQRIARHPKHKATAAHVASNPSRPRQTPLCWLRGPLFVSPTAVTVQDFAKVRDAQTEFSPSSGRRIKPPPPPDKPRSSPHRPLGLSPPSVTPPPLPDFLIRFSFAHSRSAVHTPRLGNLPDAPRAPTPTFPSPSNGVQSEQKDPHRQSRAPLPSRPSPRLLPDGALDDTVIQLKQIGVSPPSTSCRMKGPKAGS